MSDNRSLAESAQRARDASRIAEQLTPPTVASFVAGTLRRYANALDNGHGQGSHLWEPMVDDLLAGGEDGDKPHTDNDGPRVLRDRDGNLWTVVLPTVVSLREYHGETPSVSMQVNIEEVRKHYGPLSEVPAAVSPAGER
jgi:hypothetical protein